MVSVANCVTFLLIVCLVSYVQAQQQRCGQEDEGALLTFRKDLRCNDVITPNIPCPLDSWVAGSDCCTWDGVMCDEESHRVTGISLSATLERPSTFKVTRSADSRSFGRSLVRLTELQTLELSFLGFNTYLPPAWGSISKLKSLALRGCRIYGEIPKEYGKLSNLENFGIDNDDVALVGAGLSGTAGVPRELCNLRRLKSFNLRYLNLSGGIPNCIFGWASIESIDVTNGGGNGDPGGRDSRLRIPNSVGLTGALPHSLGSLKSLQSLNLNSNSLSGSIPRSIGNLINLNYLNLGMNRFTGKLPKELGDLKSMNLLSLNSNWWFGDIPSSLGNLKKIVELDLGSNRLSGRIPEPIFNLLTLEVLRLDDNKLAGPLPRGNLSGNRSSFGLRLNVSQNFISGPLNPGLLPPNTQELYLCCQRGRMANTGIPSSISTLQSLQILDLHDNQLGGPIPSSFSSLPDLNSVDLSYNNLTGTIPRAIGALGSRANLKGNPLLKP